MPRHYTDMVMKSKEKQGLAETYSWNLHPICTFCLKKCIVPVLQKTQNSKCYRDIQETKVT